jgi:hypothetical protein
MRRLFALLLIVAFATSARAEPKLVGQWKSDADLSMRFNTERSKLESKTTLFLSQLLGHMTVTFTVNTVVVDMPNVETRTAEGQMSQLTGFRETHRYRVLGTTADAVAIKSVEPVTGKDAITVYNFVGPDTMWVYSGGVDSATSTHLREYFVRVNARNALKPNKPAGARKSPASR